MSDQSRTPNSFAAEQAAKVWADFGNDGKCFAPILGLALYIQSLEKKEARPAVIEQPAQMQQAQAGCFSVSAISTQTYSILLRALTREKLTQMEKESGPHAVAGFLNDLFRNASRRRETQHAFRQAAGAAVKFLSAKCPELNPVGRTQQIYAEIAKRTTSRTLAALAKDISPGDEVVYVNGQYQLKRPEEVISSAALSLRLAAQLS